MILKMLKLLRNVYSYLKSQPQYFFLLYGSMAKKELNSIIMKRSSLLVFLLLSGLTSCNSQNKEEKELMEASQLQVEAIADEHLDNPVNADTIEVGVVERTTAEWKALLEPAEYEILRESGTEPAFRNSYYDNEEEGIYYCGGCGLPLYSSQTKFKSGTGWPSFWAPIDSKVVKRGMDEIFNMVRIEVKCAQCDSHLGHIFDYEGVPTEERHCLNSLALDFKPMDL